MDFVHVRRSPFICVSANGTGKSSWQIIFSMLTLLSLSYAIMSRWKTHLSAFNVFTFLELDAFHSASYREANGNILFLCKGSRNLVLLPADKISLFLTNVFVCSWSFILASRRSFPIASVAESFVAIFCSLIDMLLANMLNKRRVDINLSTSSESFFFIMDWCFIMMKVLHSSGITGYMWSQIIWQGPHGMLRAVLVLVIPIMPPVFCQWHSTIPGFDLGQPGWTGGLTFSQHKLCW